MQIRKINHEDVNIKGCEGLQSFPLDHDYFFLYLSQCLMCRPVCH